MEILQELKNEIDEMVRVLRDEKIRTEQQYNQLTNQIRSKESEIVELEKKRVRFIWDNRSEAKDLEGLLTTQQILAEKLKPKANG